MITKIARADDGDALKTITVQLKWKHQFQFAGYYMAVEKGFYADAKMDVRLKEAIVGQEPMRQVVDGLADFGVGTTDLLLMRNEDVPVVVLANIFQHSPLAMMVVKNSGISNVHQLANKPLMIEPHSAELFAFFALEGVKLEGMKFTEHTFNVNDLLKGRVRGMSVYSTDEPFLLKEAGIEYQLLNPIESGIDFYGDNLFTMENTIRNHPEQVDAFIAATMKGWQYALENIEETVDVILNKYGSIKSREHLLFEAERTKALVVPNIVEVGHINPYRWERIAQTYRELGQLPQDFSLEGLIHSPNVGSIPAWIWRMVVLIAAVAVIAFFIAAYVLRINRRLRSSEAQLIKANLYKETMMSIIAHDIINNIYAVRTYGEMLINNPQPITQNTATSFGRKVLFGVDAVIDVLDNLLQWVMLKQTDEYTSVETVDLLPIIKRNMDIIIPHAQIKKITITTDVTGSTMAMCSIWRIDTVIRNLLNNACKYCMPGDAITFRVETTEDALNLIIEDTGKGMTESTLETVFDDNLKSSNDNIGRVHTGFGLPLCKKLMKANGCDIKLENRPEGGLRATIQLPWRPE